MTEAGCSVWNKCSSCPLASICEATLEGKPSMWRNIAWAVALQEAGWSTEQIAIELGKSVRQVKRYFAKVKELPK